MYEERRGQDASKISQRIRNIAAIINAPDSDVDCLMEMSRLLKEVQTDLEVHIEKKALKV